MLWQQTQQLRQSKEEPVLVFTMAKVGSSSVYNSLKKQSNIPSFHVHTLSVAEEMQAKALCKEKGVYPNSRSPVPILHTYVFEKQRKYKVISLFRNPIERNLSAFFDAFELYMGMPPHRFKGSFQDLERAFHKNLDHSYCKDWFDSQFKNGTGIDVYDFDFDSQKGYKTLSSNQTDVMLLKNDLDDTLKSKLIGNFCSIENFKLNNVNITSTKKGAKLYADFKSHIRFSKAYLEEQLESKYMNHFFTEEEKKVLYKKWLPA